MPVRPMVTARRYWPKRELAVSRSLAAVAVAFMAAATVAAILPGPWHASHPRNWFIAVVCGLLGVRIIAHARRNSVGWLLLVVGVCAAVTVGCEAWSALRPAAWVATWMWWPTYALLPVVALVFPTGSLPSRRWWWWALLYCGVTATVLGPVGIGWASWSAPGDFWHNAVEGSAPRGLPVTIALLGLGGALLSLLGGIAALLLRWHRAEGDQRRLLVWAIAGAVLTAFAVGFEMSGGDEGAAWAVGAAVLPAATVIAIMRYGLYEIELVIHRSLLYGLLVLVLMAVHAAVATAATIPFPAQADTLATVVVIAALTPLYRFLHARLNQWLYGDTDNPYVVLSRLAESLAAPPTHAGAFAAVARSAAVALKLPYVAVLLDSAPDPQVLAEYGRRRTRSPLEFPMTHRGVRVGVLVAQSRSPEENLSRRERRLLEDLARQVAPTAMSERLDQDLRRVRVRLAQAREEERRQIRRELHDGIRSGLAGIGLQIDSARDQLDGTMCAPDELLGRARHNVNVTLEAVRQVVAGRLEPAGLDRGLVEALRQRTRACAEDAGIAIELDADDDLGPLTQAVEVAAYWVTVEALANVRRHSRAGSCRVGLHRTTHLELEITDDGRGLPVTPSKHDGGLLMMRERCVELDGDFSITRLEPNGTRIHVRFPLDLNTQSY